MVKFLKLINSRDDSANLSGSGRCSVNCFPLIEHGRSRSVQGDIFFLFFFPNLSVHTLSISDRKATA